MRTIGYHHKLIMEIETPIDLLRSFHESQGLKASQAFQILWITKDPLNLNRTGTIRIIYRDIPFQTFFIKENT